VVIDASRENSGGDPGRQVDVVFDLTRRRAAGERLIAGFILSASFRAAEGIGSVPGSLGWDDTSRLLSEAVRILARSAGT
jgi:3-deoxy-D-arabino-heptulosonate 7-phosphate (DAHP) synthase